MIQYASNLFVHRMNGKIPLRAVSDTLILAGNTGPVASPRVQEFYKWCSVNYDRVYTVLDMHDADKHLPYNVFAINETSLIHPRGFKVGTDPYELDVDLLVHELPGWEWPKVQVHLYGCFDFESNDIRHVANSGLHRKFNPEKTVNLQ
jgi:hypothetical protein